VAVTGRQHGKHVSTATNQRAAVEELLEQCFLCGPCQGCRARKSSRSPVCDIN
jgi:hypothetical protein